MKPQQLASTKVFLVDDDTQVLTMLAGCLKNFGVVVRSTNDSREAVPQFRAFAPDICIIDYNMPHLTGGELLNQFKILDDQVEIIFLTGETDIALATDLMKRGASDYLLKPVDLGQLVMSVGKACERRHLMLENNAYRDSLERLVLEKTQTINDALARLDKLHTGTLESLGKAMDYRDQSTSGHCRRVATITLAIAKAVGMPEDELTQTYQGAFLHDIGKLKVPDGILLKPAGLNDEEWKIMRAHAAFGFDLLSGIDFLQSAAEIVFSHHEKFDGTGYPRGLRGDQIPLGARIFSIVDSVDAMVHKRPYNQPKTLDEASAEIKRCAGAQFDPDLVGHALPILQELIHH